MTASHKIVHLFATARKSGNIILTLPLFRAVVKFCSTNRLFTSISPHSLLVFKHAAYKASRFCAFTASFLFLNFMHCTKEDVQLIFQIPLHTHDIVALDTR